MYCVLYVYYFKLITKNELGTLIWWDMLAFSSGQQKEK